MAKTAFIDVDTQIDFLFPAGALYVPGAERLIPALSRLISYAASHSIPVISTADAHSEDDGEFSLWKPHCVIGTIGQQKPSSLLQSQPLVVSSAPGTVENISPNFASQIVFEKQQFDCFSNPNLLPLLRSLQADRFVLFGVVTEICVEKAALGLLALGAHVELVTDAVQSLSEEAADRFFRHLQAQGGELTTTEAVLAQHN